MVDAPTTRSDARRPAPPTNVVHAPGALPNGRNGAHAGEGIDLSDPALYLNRELTWLAFNRRVLAEAEDPRNPLLERVKFLAITGSNLDDFFMKRIGGLMQQVAAGVSEITVDGRTPQQQIAEAAAYIREFEAHRVEVEQELFRLLAEHNIRLRSWEELTAEQQARVRAYYLRNVFPLITPLALDPAHPFPFVSNLSLNLLVSGHAPDSNEPVLARVKVPIGDGIPRLLRVGDEPRFVRLEEIMEHTLDVLFPGLTIESCDLFRVTRNANTERDEEEADDLLELIEAEVRDRRFAPIVRLELEPGMDPARRGLLITELGLDDADGVYESGGLLAVRDLMELVSIEDPRLHDPPFHPLDVPRLPSSRNIFHSIREAPVMVLHPYESFGGSVERFLRDASEDPKVRAIKMTLYRTSSDARIVGYLMQAARNGKQVAVVVELKARFDEAANIGFATQLEDAGIHVSYGVIGLKTHCKLLLVVRNDYDGLRRYVHIGTGNYHPITARLYADIGLLTADPAITADVAELFNYLTTGYGANRRFTRLLPGPAHLKPALLKRIERERAFGPQGLIQFKMNALEDADVTRALYRAAQDGVHIDLIVRDTCRLRPGIAGLSETVGVVSIVGRFLEHARVYYFRNGGAEEYFIGSADAMRRNLEHRVEVLAPVDDAPSRQTLRAMLELQLTPNRNAWVMHSDGTYVHPPVDASDRGCQQALLEWVVARDSAPPATNRSRKRRRFATRRSLVTAADA